MGMGNANSNTKHWARVPRPVVLHRMETSDCLDSRLYWAIILWSWCGPDVSDACVRKDHKGFLVRDPRTGEPVPAKLKDFLELLGLAPSMKGPLSRAAGRLEEVGAIRFGDKISGTKRAQVIYPIHEPPSGSQFKVSGPATLETWYVGHQSFGPSNLPADPELRARAISWLVQTGNRYRTELKALRARYAEECVQAVSSGLILITEKKRSRREEEPPPASQPVAVPVETPAPPEPTAGWPEGGGDSPSTLKTEVESHLKTFAIPDPLTEQVVVEVASAITTPEALDQFKEATRPERIIPRKWKVLVNIAQRVAHDAPRYQHAKSAAATAATRPMSGSERRAEAFAERYMREQAEKQKQQGGP
jgi:hypothetical protein